MMRPFRQGCARSFTVFRPYYASRCGAECSRDHSPNTACVQSGNRNQRRSDREGQRRSDRDHRSSKITHNWYVDASWAAELSSIGRGPDHRIGIRRDRVATRASYTSSAFARLLYSLASVSLLEYFTRHPARTTKGSAPSFLVQRLRTYFCLRNKSSKTKLLIVFSPGEKI